MPQYTLRFETAELANTWYHLFSRDQSEPMKRIGAAEAEPMQKTDAAEAEPKRIAASEPEPIQLSTATEPEPIQSPVESEREPSSPESDMYPSEIKHSHQCPITVEYLQQKLREREERLRKTRPPCSIPPIPPPPPKRDHSTLKRRVELKNY